MTRLSRLTRSGIFWLTVLYLVVGLAYGLVTPLFEKPDEDGHYGYILYLREHRALPPLYFAGGFPSEYKQPPLYYILAATLTGWLPDIAEPERLLATNPYMNLSVPGQRNDNRNVFLHPPNMTPVVLGARLVSLLLGLGTVIAAYYLALQLFPRRSLVPIATAAIVGFQPKFLYLATAVSNDAATAFLGALVAALLVRRLRGDDFPHFAVVLGGILGLAALTKVSGLVFFLLAGLGLLLIHRGLNRDLLRDGLIVAVVALLVGGWWYARNALLYGDPLSTNVHAVTAAQVQPLAQRFWRDLTSIERTFWANPSRTFVSPTRLDKAIIWWGRISLTLLLSRLTFHASRFTLHASRLTPHASRFTLHVCLLLLSWPLTFLLLLITYWAQEGAWAYGRLLFPALAPLALLFVLGWWYAFPPRWRRLSVTFGAGSLMIAGILIPFISIYPLYHPWREWSPERARHPVDTLYADPDTDAPIAQLVDYSLPAPYVLPGTYLPVELCWKPLAQTGTPYAVLVQLLDLSQLDTHGSPGLWGGRRTYPGLGNLPTDRWTVGRPFCDEIRVQVSPDAPTPLGAAIEVGFIEPQTGRRLRATSADGVPLDIATVRGAPILSPADLPVAERPARYILDGAIGLDRVETGWVGDTLALTLTWQSLRPVPYDAIVFVHLRDADGSLLAQVDRQPLAGRFSTSYWPPGQIVTDTISLSPPRAHDGPSVLNVGMYTWPSLARLPVVDASGVPQADDMITLDVPAALGSEEGTAP